MVQFNVNGEPVRVITRRPEILKGDRRAEVELGSKELERNPRSVRVVAGINPPGRVGRENSQGWTRKTGGDEDERISRHRHGDGVEFEWGQAAQGAEGRDLDGFHNLDF